MDPMNAPTQEERRTSLFGPIVAIATFATIALLLVSIILFNRFDESARIREQQMVAHGFDQRIAEFEAEIVPQVNWDETVAHLQNRLDLDWADQNIAGYLSTIAKFDRVFVIDPAGRPVYAGKQARRAPVADFAPYRKIAATLTANMRLAESRIGPFRPSPDGKTMISKPVQQHAVTMLNGRPELVIATLVQPDFGKVLPNHAKAPIVLATMPLDNAVLSRFASRYLVEDIATAGPAEVRSGKARVVIRNADGPAVASLVWTPRRPGLELLKRMLIPAVAGILAVALIVISLMRRSSTIASDLIASEARARHLAYHDTLTQLPNRALMFDRLRHMLAISRRYRSEAAVLCLDLDRFKEVNDTLGHHAGDELIQQVARRLAKLCRDTDTVARLGGDEFVILQPNANSNAASHLAERVLEAFRDPFELEYGIVEIGCSIGVTIVTNPDIEPAEILRQADLALYRSKDNGRSQATFFELEMDAALRMRRSLEADLRRALAAGELEMVYQPQVDHRDQISGIEALLRWTHPERGPIPPSVFVPLAEESGLILDLGEFVFARVFEETRTWTDVRIAINVSAVQLRSSAFIPALQRLIAKFDIDPENYEVEITETALLGDDSITNESISFLKRSGFSIALDDFGTGYSSLSCLQRFAVNKIKIDRSFVNSLSANEESEALVDAIVKLGKALNLNVLAEGVETEEQRQRLVTCGCSEIQGYLVSRPMPASEFSALAAA